MSLPWISNDFGGFEAFRACAGGGGAGRLNGFCLLGGGCGADAISIFTASIKKKKSHTNELYEATT